MLKKYIIILVLLVSATMLKAQNLNAERLPDMNVPRAGHNVFYADGELTVVGGHTSGFVLTPTAEYFSDGVWHVVPTVYSHDNGMAVVLNDGKQVLLAGGHEKNLGFGQSFELEIYDRERHSFEGFGTLERNRAFAQGIELDNGNVLICGNHKGNDCFEMFDGQRACHHVKDVAVWRSSPYLLPISNDDVLAFGTVWRGRFEPCDTVDHLNGEPFCVPLLKDWIPMIYNQNSHANQSFIGDKEAGDYSYIIAAQNLDGEIAFIHIQDTVFSILPTSSSVPTSSEWGKIHYNRVAVADRNTHKAHLVGNDADGRAYVVMVEYDKNPAPLTLYYTEPLQDFGDATPLLTPDGNLIVIGGIIDDNFTPVTSVWLLHTGTEKALSETHTYSAWLWILCSLVLIAIVLVIAKRIHKPTQPTSQLDAASKEMMARIKNIMETQQLHLNPDLKISDVAEAVGINKNAASACINANGSTFSQLVNDYRLEYAKKLLRQSPDMKIATVALESGFANERSFFRAFKAATGTTPKDWVKQNQTKS